MGSETRLRLAPILFTAGLALAPALMPVWAQAADGAFAVEDAEVDKPGECKIATWASFAGNHDIMAITSPACVVRLGVPVEFNGQFQRAREDGAWSTNGTLKAKVNLIPIDDHPFGLAISGGSSWDLASSANTGSFVYLPVTIPLHKALRLNLNGGWQYDAAAKIHYLTWGAGFEWNFAKPFTLIGEVFGQQGKLPDVDIGEPPARNTIREPRGQLGLRLTPQENIDVDLIWGRNINGENAHWLTLGLNVRF